ncbi:MAG TPA: aldehyde dehydrogenase family protein, partial [Hydrogenophaga sp.]|nr:aldehyde dehydrogenase family protein [Hydrogenophaga sp.]
MSTLTSINARTGEIHGKPLNASTAEDIDAAVNAASAAFETWSTSDGTQRAALLRGLAEALEADREMLVARADLESALGPVRLNGELDRTAFQLRRFADLSERGVPFEQLDDPAVAGGPPAGHPAMVRQRVPLG